MNKIKTNSNSSDEIDISAFIKELKGHWHYFALAFILFITLAFLYVNYTLPVYRSTSTVLIQDNSKSPTKNIDDILSGDLFGDQENVATEMGVLASRTVMNETIKELGLEISYFNTSGYPQKPLYKTAPFDVVYTMINPALQNIPFEVTILNEKEFMMSVECDENIPEPFSFSQKVTFGKLIEAKYFSLAVSRNDVEIPETNNNYSFIINSNNSIINSLLDNLKVETLNKEATIVVLTYDDNIPQRAIDILNTVGKSYINLDIKDKAAVASLTIKFVDEQLETTSKQLAGIEQELQDFKEQNKTVDLSTESQNILSRLNAIETDRVKSQIELKALDNLLEYVSSNNDMTQLAPSSLGLPDPLLVELIQNYQQLQAKKKSLSYGIKSSAPTLKIIDQQITDTRESLIENIKSIQKNISGTNKVLNDQISGFEGFISRVPERERELIAIKRKFDVNQNIYVYLLQKKAETSIAKATVISDNKVLDEASLSEEPVAPNKKLILIMAAMLSLLLPVLIIILKSFFSSTILNRDEITKLTDIPVLGIVGHLNKSDNLVVNHKPKSAIAEAFRSIRANLQFMGTLNQKKTILITSSVGGEGKSFVSINLATVFAIQNFKVVIVGFDLRKPKIFQDFNMGNEIGVSNYLIGQASLAEITRKTSVNNLDLISSGPIPPNPAELISKPEMKTFFDELEKKYDFIIVDTPPIGIVSDALILMQYSDINVYIIRENFSKHEFVKSLNEMYEEGKLKNISIILNDSAFSKRYGYGYGHNYGYLNGGTGYYDDEQHHLPFYKKIFRKLAGQK